MTDEQIKELVEAKAQAAYYKSALDAIVSCTSVNDITYRARAIASRAIITTKFS